VKAGMLYKKLNASPVERLPLTPLQSIPTARMCSFISKATIRSSSLMHRRIRRRFALIALNVRTNSTQKEKRPGYFFRDVFVHA